MLAAPYCARKRLLTNSHHTQSLNMYFCRFIFLLLSVTTHAFLEPRSTTTSCQLAPNIHLENRHLLQERSIPPWRQWNPFRTMILAEGWRVGWPIIDYWLIPEHISAENLECLYQQLFQKAASEFWGSAAPSVNGFAFNFGSVTLSFRNLPGDAEGMPWSVVAAFAWRMLQLTRQGWTGDYQVDLQTPTGARWIVQFAISQGGQAALLGAQAAAAAGVDAAGGGRSRRGKRVAHQSEGYNLWAGVKILT